MCVRNTVMFVVGNNFFHRFLDVANNSGLKKSTEVPCRGNFFADVLTSWQPLLHSLG